MTELHQESTRASWCQMPEISHSWVTIVEAAQLVGMHPESIRRAIRTGELEAARLGHRTYRIEKTALDAWWQSKGGRTLFPSAGK